MTERNIAFRECSKFVLVGIDTGIRYSLGIVLFEVKFTNKFFFEIEKNKRIRKLLLKNKVSTKENREMFCFLCENNYFKINYLHTGVYNATLDIRYRTIDEICKVIERYKNMGYEVRVVLEDFLFFSNVLNKKSRVASYYTVAKMQNLIGFCQGYLCSRGYNVFVIKPRVWKAITSAYLDYFVRELSEGEKAERYLKLKTKRSHIISALGIALSGVPIVIREISNLMKV